MSYFSKHFFFYIVIIFIVLSVSASYYRFIITNDYIVSFEGWCDPEYESCFTGSYYDEECDCDVEYTFKIVEKPVSSFTKQLAECDVDPFLDPMECEVVDQCSATESNCSVTYCETDCFTGNLNQTE